MKPPSKLSQSYVLEPSSTLEATNPLFSKTFLPRLERPLIVGDYDFLTEISSLLVLSAALLSPSTTLHVPFERSRGCNWILTIVFKLLCNLVRIDLLFSLSFLPFFFPFLFSSSFSFSFFFSFLFFSSQTLNSICIWKNGIHDFLLEVLEVSGPFFETFSTWVHSNHRACVMQILLLWPLSDLTNASTFRKGGGSFCEIAQTVDRDWSASWTGIRPTLLEYAFCWMKGGIWFFKGDYNRSWRGVARSIWDRGDFD